MNPNLVVFTYQGDGDFASIGTAEAVHVAARGEKITTIFINNAIYGMTGGQMAPTTLIGQKTTTSPMGRSSERSGFPVRMAELLATLDGAAKAADEKPAGKTEKITYDGHVRPIFRENCFSCHNQDDANGGLALDTYPKVMEGGSGGEVVVGGDLDNSRLWALVSHQEEPNMPEPQQTASTPWSTKLQKHKPPPVFFQI